jgi:ribulose-phosphate 3-epimerase
MLTDGFDFSLYQHMDIMDGHFVPNLSFGPPVIASLRKALPNSYIDCHCMVSEPAKWVDAIKRSGADSMTFHIESELPENNPSVLIQQIKEAGMRVGIVIKPGTPVEKLYDYTDDIDLALIMTVEPGFSGQKFMADMMPKVKALRERCPTLNIQVDGGLSPATVDAAAEAGANVIVAASAIFGSDNRKGVIDALRAGVEKYRK